MTDMNITIWPTYGSTHGRESAVAWDKFFGDLSEPIEFCGMDDHAGWSPALFATAGRKKDHVSCLTALVLDVDGGWSLQGAQEQLARYFGFIHTTKKHTEDIHRFRIILPLTRGVTPAEHAKIWQEFNARYPSRFDPACKDPNRFWYLPGVIDGGPYEVARLNGQELDADALLVKAAERAEKAPITSNDPAGGAGLETRFLAYVDAMPGAISGSGGHQATWAVAVALARGFALSEEETFQVLRDRYNPRCNPQWSERELKHKAKGAFNSNLTLGYLRDVQSPNACTPAVLPPEPTHMCDDGSVVEAPPAVLEPPQSAWQRYGVRSMKEVLQTVYNRCYENKPAPFVSTGVHEVDRIIGGYRPEMITCLGAQTNWGKALRVDEPVLTPTGWVRVDSLEVGSLVMGRSGQPCRVTGVFPQGERELFEVEFWDGATVVADGEHLWSVHTRDSFHLNRPARVMTTMEIAASKTARYVPLTRPQEFEAADLPIDPYTLGVLLGDGCLAGTTPSVTTDREIVSRCRFPGGVNCHEQDVVTDEVSTFRLSTPAGQPNPLIGALRRLDLFGKKSAEKFIPEVFFWGTSAQRIELLRGLLDTDGHVQKKNHSVSFSSASRRLTEAVRRIVLSLGGVARITTKLRPQYTYKGKKRTGRPSYRVVVQLPSDSPCPFVVSRKANAWRSRVCREPRRRIMAVRPAGKGQALCIRVDAEDSLFITRDFVVTHNTSWAVLAIDDGIRAGKRVLYVSGEDSEDLIGKRIMARRANVSAICLRDERISHERRADGNTDLSHMATAVSNAEDLPWFFDGRGKSAEYCASAVRELVQELDYQLVVVDYLQAFKSQNRAQDRRNEVTNVSRAFADAIKTTGTSGLFLSQLKRLETDTREPTKHDLKESGDVENMVEHVLLGWMNKAGERFVKCGKNKDGPQYHKGIPIEFNEETASFKRTAAWQQPAETLH